MVRRFVEEQNLRWIGEQYRQGKSALLPYTQLRDRSVLIATSKQTESAQRRSLSPLSADEIGVGFDCCAAISPPAGIRQMNRLAEHSDPLPRQAGDVPARWR